LLCLLGHNGAGKTTTISLVTGLVTKDQGSVKFYGKSIDSDLDEIRQFTGICVQRDVLYEELNVEEHLRYYARMKGFEGAELEQEIEYILNKCVL
jgi:ATP-binding cassette subfamily A (ABC1) protein 3